MASAEASAVSISMGNAETSTVSSCIGNEEASAVSSSASLECHKDGQGSKLSAWSTAVVAASLTSLTLFNSLSLGLLTVGLPQIAIDLNLPANLLLWYSSLPAPASLSCQANGPGLQQSTRKYPPTARTSSHNPRLATGCCLLTAGAVADIVGKRPVSLLGTLIHGLFTLACGLSRNGIQLIMFRVLQGVGAAMIFSTSLGILSTHARQGRAKTISFSCLGFGVPLGFAIGLVLGGVFQSTSVGWRLGFYLCSGLMMVLCLVNYRFIPQDQSVSSQRMKLWKEVDWLGLLISSACLALLSYFFVAITDDPLSIRLPQNIVILCLVAVLVPAFILWMRYQESNGRPALIPNSIWGKGQFSAVCIIVLLSWAALNSMEWFFSLYFQQIQLLSPIEASIRFLPNLIFGVILNVLTGLLIHKFPLMPLVTVSGVIAAVSPLVMALSDPAWPFWQATFWAMLLLPTSVDVIFTAASIVITNAFPMHMQSLASAVFNAVAQIGTSLGIAAMAVVYHSVSAGSGEDGPQQALLAGMRSVFWACFALSVGTVVLGALTLRGLKAVNQEASEESMDTGGETRLDEKAVV